MNVLKDKLQIMEFVLLAQIAPVLTVKFILEKKDACFVKNQTNSLVKMENVSLNAQSEAFKLTQHVFLVLQHVKTTTLAFSMMVFLTALSAQKA